MLIRELKPGQAIKIGDITITMIHKSGQAARLGIVADRGIPIVEVASQAKKEEKCQQ